MKMVKHFTSKLISLRKERRYTQKAVAEHLGVTRRIYSYWESGHFTLSIENIIGICVLYGISADELFGIKHSLIYPNLDVSGNREIETNKIIDGQVELALE